MVCLYGTPFSFSLILGIVCSAKKQYLCTRFKCVTNKNMTTRKLLFFIFATLLINIPLLAENATDAHIAGHVLDAHTNEHLSYVNVQVEGTSLGCLTDESGHFYLKN